MASSRRFFRYHSIDAGVMAADITGPVTNVEYVDNVVLQAIWAAVQATGKLTVANPTGAVQASGTITVSADLAADEKVTIESVDFVFKKEFAQNVVTCASVAAADKVTLAGIEYVGRNRYATNIVTCASVEVGDTVTVDGVVLTAIANGETPDAGEFALGTGGTADNDTATALAAAITAATATCHATAEASTNAVTITANTEGDAGNDVTLATSEGTRLAITTAGGKLSGAYDAAANEWPIGTGGTANADSATALAYAITGDSANNGTTAAAVSDAVTITSTVAGPDGNDITLTSSNGTRLAITTAGGKLAGAYDPANDEVPLGATPALNATYLANAINASANVAIDGIVTASNLNGVVTVTAVAYGTAGNAYTLTKTGAHLAVSGGGTLGSGSAGNTAVVNGATFTAVAGPPTGTNEFNVTGNNTADAAALAEAINASESAEVKDLITASASGAECNLIADTAGPDGNAYTLAVTGNITRSAATFEGGTLPAGKVLLQGSLDYDPHDPDSATWTDLPTQIADADQPATDVGSILFAWTAVGVPWVRPIYDATSGAGALDVWIAGKGA